MLREKAPVLREKLLEVKGIGRETADSIVLYAAHKPSFVIDAYTRRIFARHRLRIPNAKRSPQGLFDTDYEDWKRAFESAVAPHSSVYNDFHAQIVALGKHFCKSSRTLCRGCPLERFLT